MRKKVNGEKKVSKKRSDIVFFRTFASILLYKFIIMDITKRFLNYTQFDTQSSEDSESVPSTSKQLVFAEYLKRELESEGLNEVEMDEKG